MSWDIPEDLKTELDELVSHYPQPRSASLMVLHLIQEHQGWLSQEAIEWTATRLSLQPINVYELVTFYPMFRQEPAGKYQIKICRTLSCALGGSIKLHRQLCEKLGLDPHEHGIQTTPDGRFSVEFVECLASCGTAPVVMCNDTLHESFTLEQAEKILQESPQGDDPAPKKSPKKGKGATKPTDKTTPRKSEP